MRIWALNQESTCIIFTPLPGKRMHVQANLISMLSWCPLDKSLFCGVMVQYVYLLTGNVSWKGKDAWQARLLGTECDYCSDHQDNSKHNGGICKRPGRELGHGSRPQWPTFPVGWLNGNNSNAKGGVAQHKQGASLPATPLTKVSAVLSVLLFMNFSCCCCFLGGFKE